MLSLQNICLLSRFLPKQATLCTSSVEYCFRRISETSTSTRRKGNEDMPIKMDDPFKEPPKGCILCNVKVDHKNIQLLSQFVSSHTGHIYGRYITGLCSKKQKEVSKAIKKAQNMGLMSVTLKDPVFMKDPNICRIKNLE